MPIDGDCENHRLPIVNDIHVDAVHFPPAVLPLANDTAVPGVSTRQAAVGRDQDKKPSSGQQPEHHDAVGREIQVPGRLGGRRACAAPIFLEPQSAFDDGPKFRCGNARARPQRGDGERQAVAEVLCDLMPHMSRRCERVKAFVGLQPQSASDLSSTLEDVPCTM